MFMMYLFAHTKNLLWAFFSLGTFIALQASACMLVAASSSLIFKLNSVKELTGGKRRKACSLISFL